MSISSSNHEITVDDNYDFNCPFDDDNEVVDNSQAQAIGDGTDGALYQAHLLVPSPTSLPSSAHSNTHCTQLYHSNKGHSQPGGLNHLQQMDHDEYAHIHDTENVYYPFASKSEWELANWLSSGALSQKEIDHYLQLQCVSEIHSA